MKKIRRATQAERKPDEWSIFLLPFHSAFFPFSPTEEPGPRLCSKLRMGKNVIFFTRKMKAVLLNPLLQQTV